MKCCDRHKGPKTLQERFVQVWRKRVVRRRHQVPVVNMRVAVKVGRPVEHLDSSCSCISSHKHTHAEVAVTRNLA